jgi:uncharacterized protein
MSDLTQSDNLNLPKGGRIRSFVQHWPVATFYVSSLLMVLAMIPAILFTDWEAKVAAGLERTGIEMTTSYVTAVKLVAAAPETMPGIVLAVLQPLTPDIAAFLVMGIGFGAMGFWALFRRYRFWKSGIGWRVGTTYWAAAILAMIAISLVTAWLNSVMLPGQHFQWSINPLSLGFVGAMLAAMFLDGGGVAEETGWRGFVLPIFQARYGALVGTTILGIIWSVWHIPVKINLAFDYGWDVFAGMMVLMTIRLTLFSLVITYFYNRVGGSTFLAIAMHGLHNDSVRLQGRIGEPAYDTHWAQVEFAMIIPLGIAAAFLIWVTKGKLGQTDLTVDKRPMPAAGLA